MTVIGYRKEAAARSESGNAKHLKRLEQDVSVRPQISVRRAPLRRRRIPFRTGGTGTRYEGAVVPTQVLENFSD
jgi:hypothetical protein